MLNPLSGNMSGTSSAYGPGDRSGNSSTMEPEFGLDPASGVFFGSDSRKHEDLKEMLDANKDNLKLEAMKRIIGMIAKGRDASMLFPDVVKNVVSKNIELKKLVYIYLERYAEEQQDLALLSISTFQRALKEPNQLIRAGALRVLSSIRVTMIAPIVMLAIRDAAADMSPYVRKTAAHAIPKLYSLDMEMKPVLITVIEKLLADRTVLVIGSAVMAFTKVCPERVDLIHCVYRTLCHMMGDVDEWGQVIILNMLTRYARTQFMDPNQQHVSTNTDLSVDQLQDVTERTSSCLSSTNNVGLQLTHPTGQRQSIATGSDESCSSGESSSASGSQSETSYSESSTHTDATDESESEDHSTNANSSNRLHNQQQRNMISISSTYDLSIRGMGGATASLDPDHRLLLRSTRPLLQSRNAAVVMAVAQMHYHIGPHSELQPTVKALVRLLRGYTEVQELVLSNIVTMSVAIADVFAPHLKSFFVRTSDPTRIKLLKLTILTNVVTEKNVMMILRELQTYISNSDRMFVAAAIQAIGRCACAISSITDSCLNGLVCLLSNKNEAVVAEAVVVIKRLLQTQSVDPSDIILQMAGLMDHIRIAQAKAAILWLLGEFCRDKPAAVNVLKRTAKSFTQEDSIVKLQIINLAVKLQLSYKDESLLPLCQYVISLSRYDQNYDIRDRARLIKYFVDNNNLCVQEPSASKILLIRVTDLFLGKKPPPVNLSQNNEYVSYQLGSLSHYIKTRAVGYEPLAPFLDHPSPSDVRNIPDPPPPPHTFHYSQQESHQQVASTSSSNTSRHHYHHQYHRQQRQSTTSSVESTHYVKENDHDDVGEAEEDSDSWESGDSEESDSDCSGEGSDEEDEFYGGVVLREAAVDKAAAATASVDRGLISTLNTASNENRDCEAPSTSNAKPKKDEQLLDL